jgi:hypothetical protein
VQSAEPWTLACVVPVRDAFQGRPGTGLVKSCSRDSVRSEGGGERPAWGGEGANKPPRSAQRRRQAAGREAAPSAFPLNAGLPSVAGFPRGASPHPLPRTGSSQDGTPWPSRPPGGLGRPLESLTRLRRTHEGCCGPSWGSWSPFSGWRSTSSGPSWESATAPRDVQALCSSAAHGSAEPVGNHLEEAGTDPLSPSRTTPTTEPRPDQTIERIGAVRGGWVSVN